jgi:hypothetical protein
MTVMNINNFKANLRYGGVRPTLFQVQINNPVVTGADTKASFTIQSASLPAWNVGTIQIPFMGRRLPSPGDREFQPWSVEVINDEDFLVRNAFETWNNRLNLLEDNSRGFATSEASEYTSNALVTQLSKTGRRLRTYEFINVYPAFVGEIQLAWAAENQIEIFPVTLMYDSYRVIGAGSNAGGV